MMSKTIGFSALCILFLCEKHFPLLICQLVCLLFVLGDYTLIIQILITLYMYGNRTWYGQHHIQLSELVRTPSSTNLVSYHVDPLDLLRDLGYAH